MNPTEQESIFLGGLEIIPEKFAEFIGADVLSPGRLDWKFYSPTFVANEKRLRASGMKLKRLGDSEIAVSLSDGTHDTIEALGGYRTSGIRYLTSTDVIDGFHRSPIYISPEAHLKNKRSGVQPGDLLIAVRGSSGVGTARIYPENAGVANINTAIARIRLQPGIDGHWLAAYLNTWTGRLSTLRIANGVAKLNLNMEETADILVPVPDISVQKEIGNKLRQSERLRNSAATRQASVIAQIGKLFGQAVWNASDQFGWMPASAFEASRLDAWFYKPYYREMATHLRGNANLVAVSTVAKPVSDGVVFSQLQGSEFEYFEIADVEVDSGIITSNLVSISEAPSRAKVSVKPGDVLVSTVRPNRKGVAVVSDSARAAICSSGFAPLRCASQELAHYIRTCLVHDIGTDQLMRWNTGATYPAIDREVPLRVLIPWPGERAAVELGALMKEAADEFAESQRLVDGAYSDVEKLMDGSFEAGDRNSG